MANNKSAEGVAVKATPKANFLNDMQLLDAIVEADRGNVLAYVNILDMIFDKENKEIFYDSIRAEDGRVPLDLIPEKIKEIIIESGEQGKN